MFLTSILSDLYSVNSYYDHLTKINYGLWNSIAFSFSWLMFWMYEYINNLFHCQHNQRCVLIVDRSFLESTFFCFGEIDMFGLLSSIVCLFETFVVEWHDNSAFCILTVVTWYYGVLLSGIQYGDHIRYGALMMMATIYGAESKMAFTMVIDRLRRQSIDIPPMVRIMIYNQI